MVTLSHTKIHRPDARPAARIQDAVERLVHPGGTDIQAVVLHQDADVMLEIWTNVSLAVFHSLRPICGEFLT